MTPALAAPCCHTDQHRLPSVANKTTTTHHKSKQKDKTAPPVELYSPVAVPATGVVTRRHDEAACGNANQAAVMCTSSMETPLLLAMYDSRR